ncbi:hypothetical protein V6Z12_D04G127800 [Gossypium hirsutum]
MQACVLFLLPSTFFLHAISFKMLNFAAQRTSAMLPSNSCVTLSNGKLKNEEWMLNFSTQRTSAMLPSNSCVALSNGK